MRKKSTHPRRRSRSGVGILATFTATFVTLLTMLIASVGSAPAAPVTKTAWIPLECFIAQVIPTHVAAALTTTLPDQVSPGDTFNMVNTTTEVTFPPSSQQAAGNTFGPNVDAVQGIVQDFETKLTGGTVAFAPTTGGPTQTSNTQFNSVRAVQPPNAPATNAHINGGDTTRGGFQPSTPPESFSFGDPPVDPTGGSGTAYGPAPGVGGAFNNPSAGTPDFLPPIGPITVTGAAGTNLVIDAANPGGATIGATGVEKVADNTIAFHDNNGTPTNTTDDSYTSQVGADCGIDTTNQKIPSPDPSFVTKFEIPIVGTPADGVGSASARGTDPDADLGEAKVAAQYSAITNCDETANTRPFIVRWTEGNTTNTFRRTGTDTSTCENADGDNFNSGSGTGTINGSPGATVAWGFRDDSPDNVSITVTPATGDALLITGAPQPLSGTPGGVWVFGDLPWPAGGGT